MAFNRIIYRSFRLFICSFYQSNVEYFVVEIHHRCRHLFFRTFLNFFGSNVVPVVYSWIYQFFSFFPCEIKDRESHESWYYRGIAIFLKIVLPWYRIHVEWREKEQSTVRLEGCLKEFLLQLLSLDVLCWKFFYVESKKDQAPTSFTLL